MSTGRTIGWSVLAVVLLVPAWFLGYHFTNFIGDPVEVVGALPAFLTSGDTWVNVGISVARVFGGLLAGVVLGTAMAFAINRQGLLKETLTPYVTLALRTPSAIAAIVSLSIFHGSEIGYVAVVAYVTFPYVTTGLLDGLRSADRELDQMAQIYHLSTWAHMRHVLGPFIAPYMFAALRNAHALAWKIIVVVEIFGAATEGFGIQFSYAWEYFRILEVHLWLLLFMAVVLFAEYCVLRPAERRVFRWRDAR
jgi:NitT/TauT family transport system permease protein